MPPCSKSNTGTGPIGADTEKDLDVNVDYVLWAFSRSSYYFSTGLFFSNTTGCDMSNGVGLVSVYALWKKLAGVQGRPHEHPNPEKHENLEFWPAVGLRWAQFSSIFCVDAQVSSRSDS